MRRWRKSRPYRRRHSLAGKVIAVLLLFVVLFVIVDIQLRPFVGSMVTNQARVTFVSAVNEAVTQEIIEDQISYTDLVNIERNDAGQILAITTDMAQMNTLKASMLQSVQAHLTDGHMDTGIALGTLLGSELLHGRGPKVPVRLTLVGNVIADFESTFESAGINQTKHRIVLNIHTSVYSFLPGFDTTTEVETSIPVAETVIVGEVPQLMANFK